MCIKFKNNGVIDHKSKNGENINFKRLRRNLNNNAEKTLISLKKS